MFGYRFHVLLDYCLNHFQFCRFEALIVYKLDRKLIEFGLGSSFYDVHMQRCMVVGVEQESVSKQRKYRWHVFQISRKNR
jgi:hypothetical protein